MAKRIAIVGGGTAGLSAAYSLQKKKSAGTPIEFVLYEASQYFGGVIRTERIDECIIEAGPDSFLTEKPWAADLCRELGLGDQLIASNDAERKTYMLVNGRLVPLESNLDNGDVVEIFTSKAETAGPSRDWMSFVKSQRARNKIRQWFARERREDAIEEGKDAISRMMRKQGLPLQRLLGGEALVTLAKDLRFTDVSAPFLPSDTSRSTSSPHAPSNTSIIRNWMRGNHPARCRP